MTFDELAQELDLTGPQISINDIHSFETEMSAVFPDDFRIWLQRFNGGMLDARFEAAGTYPDILFGIRDDNERFSIRAAMRRLQRILDPGVVPIGDEHSGALLGLQTRGVDVGSVKVVVDNEHRTVAESFTEYIKLLVPARHYSESDEWYMLGRGQLSAHRYEEALESFLRAWAVSAEAKHAHWIAETLAMLGQREKSYVWYERAYQLDTSNNKCATTYAAALVKQGRRDEAIRVLREVLQNTPTYGPARKLVASIL